MIALCVCILVFVALIATLVAAASREIEKLLWGTIMCSLGLGFAVLISGGGYFAILVISTFLVTDLMLYLYFRSLSIYPKNKNSNKKLGWINRVFMIWLGLCGFLASLHALQEFFEKNSAGEERVRPIFELHKRIWGEDWYLLLLTAMILVLITFGGLFLVRREKQ